MVGVVGIEPTFKKGISFPPATSQA